MGPLRYVHVEPVWHRPTAALQGWPHAFRVLQEQMVPGWVLPIQFKF